MLVMLRSILLTLAIAALVLFGFWRLTTDHQRRLLDELDAINADLQARLEQREAMIERLGRSRRVAHIRVTDQTLDGAGGVEETKLLFTELDDRGAELATQAFTLPGDVLFVDAWTVKFDQERVAEGHPLFGRTLLLLRRIYTDRMAPIDGVPIDTPGAVPPGYASSEVASYEQRIWEHFWSLATDPEIARSMGVRVAQGEAVYKPVEVNQTYELIVDAAGGMSLTPLDQESQALSRVVETSQQ